MQDGGQPIYLLMTNETVGLVILASLKYAVLIETGLLMIF